MNHALKQTLLSLAVFGIMLSPAMAADMKALDGKTYTIETTQVGAAKTETDDLVFAAGTFRSTGCDEYGFAPAAYDTTGGEDGAMAFSVTTKSDKEGTMTWNGNVKGDEIEGTAVWQKAGQDDIAYSYKGSLKK